ncbi:MAG: type IV secretion system protein VirB10 [Janthinobacterium lividum]
MTSDEALDRADALAAPAVSRPRSSLLLPAGIVGVLALGVLTFAGLYRPGDRQGAASLPVTTRAPSTTADLPPVPVLAPVVAAAAAPPPVAPVPPVTVIRPVVAAPVEAPRQPTSALIVDLTPVDKPATDAAGRTPAAADKLSANESFAARVSKNAVETVGTDKLSSTDQIIPQGTIITGVLETAINSDLPGLVRAVVSRDVTGFDGSKVLIPRGSRLIGQYSNGIALGQSRAFVIWTRLLRSDGVSVQLGSAATDPLGTAGLGGKVDSHFLRRFGAATLLSVVTSGLDYFSNRNRGTQVVVGSSTQANQLASVALQRDIDIPPTIKIAQGTPVRVFVARDLDFAETVGKRP